MHSKLFLLIVVLQNKPKVPNKLNYRYLPVFGTVCARQLKSTKNELTTQQFRSIQFSRYVHCKHLADIQGEVWTGPEDWLTMQEAHTVKEHSGHQS